MTTPTIIGIAGGTASGKSSFAALLYQALQTRGANLISLDSYYLPQDHLNLHERSRLNFDHPGALELDLLARHLEELCAGHDIEIPQYDLTTHTRTACTQHVTPSPYIVVDGLHTFYHEGIRKQLSHRVFVHADDDIRLARRIERDIRERGRTRESVLRQWEESVQPMFLEFIFPSREHAQVQIENNTEIVQLQQLAKQYLSEVL